MSPTPTRKSKGTSATRSLSLAGRMAGYLSALLLIMVISTSYGTVARAASSPAASTASKPSLSSPTLCNTCWHPALKTSWQWQLSGTVDQSYNVVMYDIDMFDNSASVVKSLHKAGRIVICYIDAGTWENWRPDAGQFPNSVKGKPVSGWLGERWLDIRQLSILESIMTARIQLCQSKGFDGVEFDNVDGYTNNTGFPLSYNEQLAYNTWLANTAHSNRLSVALKNDLDQISDLLPYFDWALDEQCFQYSECSKLMPFINAGKAVMEVEYSLNTTNFCSKANSMNFNSMKKHLNLGSYRVACR